jgi:hypothetical protein
VRWTVAAGAGGMAAIWAGGIGRVARREDRRGGSGARQNAENKRCASLPLALLPDKGGGRREKD